MTRGVRISLGGWEDFPFIWIELYLGGGGEGGGWKGEARATFLGSSSHELVA